MATLVADFRADLLAMARQHLTAEWGPEVAQIADDDVLTAYFDALRRRPALRPRKIWMADDFVCPPEYLAGWEQLRRKITDGEDLRPHLSRGHAKLSTLDGLLNEWSVHHLHLGMAPSSRDPSLIERSGPVLFARITPDDFYAINVYTHGDWEQASVLESLHRNWPDTIKSYRIRGIQGEPLTEEQRRNLRKVNMQTATTTADGTVYMAIGGGVASSGTSAEAVRRADMLWSDAEQLQIAVQEQLEKFMPSLKAGGYAGQAEIKATLVAITSVAFQVVFPEYGVLANVKLDGGWVHRAVVIAPGQTDLQGGRMKQTIRTVAEQKERTGTFHGFTFVGWEYEEGWLLSIASVGDESAQNLWVDGTFAAPRFSEVAPSSLNGLGRTEVDAEPIDATADVKEAVLGMIWEWEVWEPITVAGTCAIDSLVRMLDLPQDTLLAWFRIAGRNPSVPEQIVLTLEENGYTVDIAGPEGFGKFHEHHRLVAMFRKDNPQNGHVVLIYAFDKGVFDAAGVFKQVGDILWSARLGYNRGPVWRIQKR